jgi:TRAP-type C4-dicarboxylate transport system substrate-binding protein
VRTMLIDAQRARRRFVLRALALSGACALPPCAGAADGAKCSALKLSVALGPAFALGGAARAWSQAVAQRSNGALSVQVFPGATLANRDPAREFAALRGGVIDLAVGSTLFWSAQVPALGVASLPWLAPSPERLSALAAHGIADRLTAALADAGAVALAFAPLGHRELATTTDRVHVPTDLRDLRVRTAAVPLVTDLFADLGARPVALGPAAAREALSAGALDAEEGPPAIFAAARVDALGLKFVTVWGAMGELAVLAVNGATWQLRAAEEQRLLRDTAREAAARLAVSARQEADNALEAMRLRGTTITRLLAPAQEAFAAATEPFRQRWTGVIGADLVAAAEAASRAAVP